MKSFIRRLGLLTGIMFLMLTAAGLAPARADTGGQPPVLAYYYIWFNHSSWGHGKSDYPALGRYSSDDESVMRQQIELAKGAGIDGFIVSWKETPSLDARLAKLVRVAQQLDFKLAVIYEGLDYSRQPLPETTVAAGLKWFESHYAGNPVFSLYGKPLVVWSGTWMFSAGDIEKAVAPVRNKLLVLASEKDVAGYERVAASVGGDAYYWSSVNPDTNSGYGGKLREMAAAVHARNGLWIAPFAPGFDARGVGGKNVVTRGDGDTLRAEYNTAVSSSPDALGLISWNEYSENSEVEPSHANGTLYLRVLRQLTHAIGPSAAELNIDSSESSSGSGGGFGGDLALPLLIVAAALFGVWFVAARMRRGRDDHSTSREPAPPPPPRRHVWRDSRLRATIRRRDWQWPILILAAVATVAAAMTVATIVPKMVHGQAQVNHDPNPTLDYMGLKPPLDKTNITVAAAGDIACSPDDPAAESAPQFRHDICKQQETADLISNVIHPDAVLALGDNDYPSGSLKGFESNYLPGWGRFKAITYPVTGNHEYGTPGAGGYFGYYGAAAGRPGEGWYSYDLGNWHMVALNSECEYIGGCGPGSPEEKWLRSDLAAHPSACILAYWHQPRWSSGTHGLEPAYDAFWRDLYAAGADVVLNGHDHDYERFAPLDPSGAQDPDRGIREFVVGTGGATHYLIHKPVNGSQHRIQGVFGALDLTLQPHGYSWKFISAPGASVLDSGSASCH